MDVPKLPVVKSSVLDSIIAEVFVKTNNFGITDFRSSLEEDNKELAKVLYDSVADHIADGDPELSEKVCAAYKVACHLLYKSLEKHIEIKAMEG
jgi:hypothetical protein